MYREYGDEVEFLLIYVREAHAGDAWALEVNKREGFEVPLARTYEEKDGYADMCVRKLDIEFPTAVDRMDFLAEADYSAWPERLYLVDEDGVIVYKGGPGPFDFEPEELEDAIRAELDLAPMAREPKKERPWWRRMLRLPG